MNEATGRSPALIRWLRRKHRTTPLRLQLSGKWKSVWPWRRLVRCFPC